MQDREAFRIGLHQAVPNSVMHHFDEVARARWSDMSPALIFRRCESLKDHSQSFDRLLVAADHEAIAFFQSPHAAGGAAVDEMKALIRCFGVAALRVFVV